jgi:hypothetical protein
MLYYYYDYAECAHVLIMLSVPMYPYPHTHTNTNLAKFAFLFRESRVTYKSVSPAGQPFQAFSTSTAQAYTTRNAHSQHVHKHAHIHMRIWLTYFISYFFWWDTDYQDAGAEMGL